MMLISHSFSVICCCPSWISNGGLVIIVVQPLYRPLSTAITIRSRWLKRRMRLPVAAQKELERLACRRQAPQLPPLSSRRPRVRTSACSITIICRTSTTTTSSVSITFNHLLSNRQPDRIELDTLISPDMADLNGLLATKTTQCILPTHQEEKYDNKSFQFKLSWDGINPKETWKEGITKSNPSLSAPPCPTLSPFAYAYSDICDNNNLMRRFMDLLMDNRQKRVVNVWLWVSVDNIIGIKWLWNCTACREILSEFIATGRCETVCVGGCSGGEYIIFKCGAGNNIYIPKRHIHCQSQRRLWRGRVRRKRDEDKNKL